MASKREQEMKPLDKYMGAVVDGDVHRRLKAAAARADRTLESLVVEAIEEKLERMEKGK